jgi:hypothetical protein
MAKEEKLKKQ